MTEKRWAGRAAGRVQGVGFRAFVQQTAQAAGFTGWVRNMSDGTVTMEVQGPEEKFSALDTPIREGNAWIGVESLDWEPLPAVPEEATFEIRR